MVELSWVVFVVEFNYRTGERRAITQLTVVDGRHFGKEVKRI